MRSPLYGLALLLLHRPRFHPHRSVNRNAEAAGQQQSPLRNEGGQPNRDLEGTTIPGNLDLRLVLHSKASRIVRMHFEPKRRDSG